MGLNIEKSDVRRLLEDEELAEDVVKAIIDDPDALEELAEDVAEELSDMIEDEPELRRTIIDAAIATPAFRQKVVRELAKEIGD